jgi:mRNA interferase HigB
VRIIAIRILRVFWETKGYEDSEAALHAWHQEAKSGHWKGPSDIKAKFGSASILKNGRVVFNISGNKYRLVVKVEYAKGIVYIRFIGTHAAYDKVDCNTV